MSLGLDCRSHLLNAGMCRKDGLEGSTCVAVWLAMMFVWFGFTWRLLLQVCISLNDDGTVRTRNDSLVGPPWEVDIVESVNNGLLPRHYLVVG